MAKIERAQDLPEWFDLEKYSGCKSFGATEWFEQLVCRKHLLRGNPEYPDRQIVTRPIFKEITYKNEHGEVIENGALMLSDHVAMNQSEAMSQWRERIGKDIHSLRAAPLAAQLWLSDALKDPMPTVASMTIADLRDVVRHSALKVGFSKTPSLQNHIHNSDFDNLPESVKCEEIYLRRFALERSNRAAILVNLDTSNADLKLAFSAWLKEARADQQSAAKRNKPSYNRWARYGLLPYLDLRIWEMETGNEIPDRVVCRAISDVKNSDAGEENIRKTLTPLAAELMRDLSALQALAAIETSGKSKPETFQD
jgi:hypothetical protein